MWVFVVLVYDIVSMDRFFLFKAPLTNINDDGDDDCKKRREEKEE